MTSQTLCKLSAMAVKGASSVGVNIPRGRMPDGYQNGEIIDVTIESLGITGTVQRRHENNHGVTAVVLKTSDGSCYTMDVWDDGSNYFDNELVEYLKRSTQNKVYEIEDGVYITDFSAIERFYIEAFN